ncbi:MAG: tellurite resistance TerB family protein [Alphaproteobacteria bacterium]
MSSVVSPHTAIIYVMVTVSAADAKMTDRELRTIGDIVRTLPVFRGFDQEKLMRAAHECADILAEEKDGLRTVFALAREALSVPLRETAYACAVEVAASDDRINREEMRILELVRDGLHVDRLIASAIERASQARHARA